MIRARAEESSPNVDWPKSDEPIFELEDDDETEDHEHTSTTGTPLIKGSQLDDNSLPEDPFGDESEIQQFEEPGHESFIGAQFIS